MSTPPLFLADQRMRNLGRHAELVGRLLLITSFLMPPASLWWQPGLQSGLLGLFAMLNTALPGVFALMVAQLIKFLGSEDAEPGWLLSHGRTILHGCVAIMLLRIAALFIHLMVYLFRQIGELQQIGMTSLALITQVLLAAAQILVALGLAEILRRVLPMIEESKATV
jgi:hypothetical protein